jgi:phosphoribosylformylglycinamidine cyclo-ligase
MDKKKLTYQDSGINIDRRKQIVRNIQSISEANKRDEVLSGIGGFAGLFQIKNYTRPVTVSAVSGIGTKLIIANMADKFDTIGKDLVARCVNNLITYGAEPIFFLDYLASSQLDVSKTTSILKGISQGCKEAGCSLIGGEIQELPDVFNMQNLDLAGFGVGVAEKDNLINSAAVESGNIIIGVASSGLHSSGFSLCRKLFFDKYKLSTHSYIDLLERPLFEELLEPAKIYVKPVLEIINRYQVSSMSNITGGGLIENVPRSIPFQYQANIDFNTWEIPRIFKAIQNMAHLSTREMLEIFNMGIGLVLVVKEKDAGDIVKILKDYDFQAFTIGKIARKKSKERIVFRDLK